MRSFLRACGNVVRLLFAPLWLALRYAARPKSPWVELRIAARLREVRVATPRWRRLLPNASRLRETSLEDVRELARAIAADPKVQGLLVTLPPLEAGWAACESLRQALQPVRTAGKVLVCYLPQGGGSRELFVALCASRVLASPYSSVSPLGVASGPLYLKRLLDRVGIEVQAQATGQYKSAAEPALRETMSDASREQLSELLAAFHGGLTQALIEHGLDPARVEQAFARGLMTAAEARDLGIFDALAYEDELPALTAGAGAKPPTGAARYLNHARMRLWQPVREPGHVAVIVVRGAIVTEGLGIGRSNAELGPLVTALREVSSDESARAVVLYVSSPGGSALASDLIHREVERLVKAKPVVAYFGDVAASGGYYIAAPCTRIVAQSVSITGSIGVISVKPAIAGLLELIGVRAEVVRSAPHADMFSLARKLTVEEEQQLTAHTQALYGRFVAVVAQGRKRSPEQVEPFARGRVWSGAAACERGLVDVLGGFDRALEEARSLVADLEPGARAALKARVHTPKAHEPPPPRALPDAAAALLALLPGELELFSSALRGEAAAYYALGLEDPKTSS